MSADVVVSRRIAAPPETVWALLADLSRMPEWSPENERVEWLGGATQAASGARFRGTNRNGTKSWKSVGEVTDCEPARRLAFGIKTGPFRIAEWTYTVEPNPEGCLVTEGWTDRRNALIQTLSKHVTGVHDRPTHNRRGMEETLRRLAVTAERNGTGCVATRVAARAPSPDLP